MRLDALRHLADIARSIAKPDKLVVMGSSSLFASFSEIDRADGPLAGTYDADLIFYPFDEQVGRILHDALGANEEFHNRFGYYADILRPLAAEEFTPGWEERLVPLQGFEDTVFCLDPYDMAVCKLRAGRPKDIALLVYLLQNGYLEAGKLKAHLDATPMQQAVILTCYPCLREVLRLAAGEPGPGAGDKPGSTT